MGEAGMLDDILNMNKPASKIRGNWSEDFKDLVARCLDKNRNTRIKIEELVSHPFLAGAE